MPIPSSDATRTPVERAFYESFIIGNRWSVTRLYAQNMSASRIFKNELRHLAYERGVNLRHMDKEIEATRRELDHIHIGEEDLLYLPTEEEKLILDDVKENMPAVGMNRKIRGKSWKYSVGARDTLGVRSRSGSRVREISRVERGFLGMVHLYLHQRRRGSSKAFSQLHLEDGTGDGSENVVSTRTESKKLTEADHDKLEILDNAKNIGDAVKNMKLNQIDDYYKDRIMKLGENLASIHEGNTSDEKIGTDTADGRRSSATPSQDRARTPKSRSPSSGKSRKHSLMYSKESSELPSNAYNAILTQSRNRFLALTESDHKSDWSLDEERKDEQDEKSPTLSLPSSAIVSTTEATGTPHGDRAPAEHVNPENNYFPNIKHGLNKVGIQGVMSSSRTLGCIPEILPSIEEEGMITQEPGLITLRSPREIRSSDSPFPYINSNISSGRKVSFDQAPIRKTSSASPASRKISSATGLSRENNYENKSCRDISSATSIRRSSAFSVAPSRKMSSCYAGGRKMSSTMTPDSLHDDFRSSGTTTQDNWENDPGWEEHRTTKQIKQSLLPPISPLPSNDQAANLLKRPSRISLDTSLNRKNSMTATRLADQDRQRSKSLPGGELPEMLGTLVRRHTDGAESTTAMVRKQSSTFPSISRSSYNNFYNEKDLKDTTAKYISRHMKVDITKLSTPLST